MTSSLPANSFVPRSDAIPAPHRKRHYTNYPRSCVLSIDRRSPYLISIVLPISTLFSQPLFSFSIIDVSRALPRSVHFQRCSAHTACSSTHQPFLSRLHLFFRFELQTLPSSRTIFVYRQHCVVDLLTSVAAQSAYGVFILEINPLLFSSNLLPSKLFVHLVSVLFLLVFVLVLRLSD